MVISALTLAEGTGAFSAFKTGLGARALAMGGAFVAVADDATAVKWNPAGLVQLDDTRISGMSTDLFGMGITHQFVGGMTNLAGFGLGIAWERSSVSSQMVDDQGDAGQAFSWNESVIIGSFATNVMDMGLAGVNIKYYIADSGLGNSATGFGFDLGLLINLGDMFTLGVNAADIGGSKITWDTGTENTVSALYTAGLAMKLIEGALILAADMDFNDSGMGDAHVGIEFKVIDELALRGGVVLTNNFADANFTAGAGINVAGLYVDAAYILNEQLGNTLVLSAEFSLGDLLGEEEVGTEPAPTQ
jgi:hypothetical protein